jgi:hypothetical protein
MRVFSRGFMVVFMGFYGGFARNQTNNVGIFMRNDFPVIGQTVCYGRYR